MTFSETHRYWIRTSQTNFYFYEIANITLPQTFAPLDVFRSPFLFLASLINFSSRTYTLTNILLRLRTYRRLKYLYYTSVPIMLVKNSSLKVNLMETYAQTEGKKFRTQLQSAQIESPIQKWNIAKSVSGETSRRFK